MTSPNDSNLTPESLLAALMSEDMVIGREAAEKLKQLYDEQAIPYFLKALRNSNSRVQYNGAHGLSLFKDKALPILIDVLRDKTASTTTRSIATGVMNSLSHAAVPSLIDEDSFVRCAATFPLGNIADKRALEPLIHSLRQDTDGEVREWAAFALGSLKDERAFAPLVDALEDSNQRVRFRAVGSLGRLAHSGLYNEHVVESLLHFLNKNDDLNLSWTTILALGDFRDERCFGPLMSIIQDETKHYCCACYFYHIHNTIERLAGSSAVY